MNAAPEIPGFLDRRPIIWSYSLLDAFRNKCPLSAQAMYIDKTVPYVETPERKEGNDGHEALNLRVGAKKPLPDAFRYCETFAKPFDGREVITENWYYVDANGNACDRFAKNKFGHGKLDLVLIDGDRAFLNDWKFGKHNPKYETPYELEVNAVLLKAKYPHLKTIKGTYTYTKAGVISEIYDLSHVQDTWNDICQTMRTIYNYRAIGEFPKKKSPLCAWCHRYDCSDNTNPKRP